MSGWRRARGSWLWLGLPLVAGCAGDGDGGEAARPPAEQPSASEATPAPSGGDATGAPPTADARSDADGPAPSPLMNPLSPELNQMAPATFRARFTTSKGQFVIEAHREWAPNGVDRFYNLVRHGFFDEARFFRVLDGFMAQFGINGDPSIQARWRTANIPDDQVTQSNTRGRVTFAQTGMPNSRSTQMFINFGDNAFLDPQNFPPIGEVVEGMDVVDQLYSEYGEGAPDGPGPSQMQIQAQGNYYLDATFPNLDYIERTEIIEDR